jgi:ribosomal protein S18 acetylase RimI-like enzyme
MTDVLLVPAVDDDLAEIAALMNRAYRKGDPAAWNSESYIEGPRTSEDLLREEIARQPEGAQLVWREASALRGTVWVAPRQDGIWYLGSLAIDPAAQNGGMGRKVLGAAEAWVQARGGHAVRMTVINIRAGLLAWYQRRGYTITDETEEFPYGDDRFGTPQRSDLHFLVLTKQLI